MTSDNDIRMLFNSPIIDYQISNVEWHKPHFETSTCV